MGHPNDSLCEQNTPHRRTERQGGFYPNLAFLGLDELADFTAEILFHIGFFLSAGLSSGKIDFPTVGGKAISKANHFAVEVELFPWKCLKTASTSAGVCCSANISKKAV